MKAALTILIGCVAAALLLAWGVLVTKADRILNTPVVP